MVCMWDVVGGVVGVKNNIMGNIVVGKYVYLKFEALGSNVCYIV